MYLSGLSVTDVANIMGCSNRSVSQWNIESGNNRQPGETLKLKGIVPPSQKGRKRSLETRLKMSGSYNHQWKGGITKTERRIRMSWRMINWRKAIYERDDYTCQMCMCKGRNELGDPLNAHHKNITLKTLVETYNTFSECMSYEPFWEISNGITYCERCHKKIHRMGLEINRLAEGMTL